MTDQRDSAVETGREVPTLSISPNPVNPRKFFNAGAMDQLMTSIQEVGIMVPLIVFRESGDPERYVLLDGERRWKSALTLGLEQVPINEIPEPTEYTNLLRMFNIHSVREDWALVAIALSLRSIIKSSGEDRETRLAEMTGLPRGTVRRAKRILSLPAEEIRRIEEEAHLDRAKQVHREDLYLEIDAAESVIRKQLPEIGKEFTREHIIRQFARKREEDHLKSVTEFRSVAKLVSAAVQGLVPREPVIRAVRNLIEDVAASPTAAYERIAAAATEDRALVRRTDLLVAAMQGLGTGGPLSEELRESLALLRQEIDRLLVPQ